MTRVRGDATGGRPDGTAAGAGASAGRVLLATARLDAQANASASGAVRIGNVLETFVANGRRGAPALADLLGAASATIGSTLLPIASIDASSAGSVASSLGEALLAIVWRAQQTVDSVMQPLGSAPPLENAQPLGSGPPHDSAQPRPTLVPGGQGPVPSASESSGSRASPGAWLSSPGAARLFEGSWLGGGDCRSPATGCASRELAASSGGARAASSGRARLTSAPRAGPAAASVGASVGAGSSTERVASQTRAGPPAGSAGGATSGAGSAGGSSILLLLAGLLLMAAPLAMRRLRLASEPWRAAAFVLIPERPG